MSALEKAENKLAKTPRVAGPKRTVQPARVKIIWEVCSPTGIAVATFAYPDKVAAEAKAAALSKSKGSPHAVRGTKVPMD